MRVRALVVGLLLPSVALGNTAARTRLAPALRREAPLVVSPWPRLHEVHAEQKVMVRFSSPPSAAERARLAAAGARLAERPSLTGSFLAYASRAGLRALDATPTVRRVEPAAVSQFARLLDAESVQETRTDVLQRAALAARRSIIDGTGLAVGDVDSDAFVFHPDLFRADAGAFAWIDVDRDGRFTPGTDAVDLDRDGVAGPREIARALRVELRATDFSMLPSSDAFDAVTDYVYLDDDGNGRRDFGAGFDEVTPAFGEPIFVVDDADGDGKLAPTERLLRLGTTKYAHVRRDGEDYVRGDRNGHGIFDYGMLVTADATSAAATVHGTYMSGIIAGGAGAHHPRGLAQGVDLYLVATPSVDELDWLAQQPVVSVSLPWGTALEQPLDGSSELEAAVDAMWDAGIFATASIGNSGGDGSHVELVLDPEQPVSFDAKLYRPAQGALVSGIVPHAPDGTTLEISLATTGDPGTTAQSWSDRSLRGTALTSSYVASTANVTGPVHVTVTLHGGSAQRVFLYASASDGLALTFSAHVAHTSTIISPASSDKDFVATGYVVHGGAAYGATEDVGALASFASKGPRPDGRTVDGIAAPVNPVGPTIIAAQPTRIAERAWPGTSCSSPAVAAAVALLRQVDPAATAQQLRDRLRATARKDAFTGTDPNEWGSGKLDVAAAAGLPSVATSPLAFTLLAPATAAVGSTATLRVVLADASADRSRYLARWDLDYDGTWDTDWEPLADREVPTGPGAELAVRVEVHDDTGAVTGRAARIALEPEAGCSFGARSPTAPCAWLTLTPVLWALKRRKYS